MLGVVSENQALRKVMLREREVIGHDGVAVALSDRMEPALPSL
jgi:hypothetical protein